MKLKSTVFLITTFCITLGSQAQNYYFRESSYLYAIDYYDNFSFNPCENQRATTGDLRSKNNVSGSKRVKVNHKQDTIEVVQTTYNKKGRIIFVESVNKKGLKKELKVHYINDTLLSHYETKTKKETNKISFEYDNEVRLTNLLHIENGKKKFEIIKVYEGKLLKESTSIEYRKRKQKSSKMINTINDEGRIIKTAYYKNDKLDRVWEYDCSEKGTEVKTKKSQEGVPSSSSCSWKQESSDGSYIHYFRTLNGKNINLFENHYNKDSVLVKRKTYNGEDRLMFERTYYDNHNVYFRYKKNGKVRSYSSETSDSEIGVISTSSVFYGLGKFHRSSQKSYNDRGLLVEVAGNYNGKQSHSYITYTYLQD